MGGQLSKQQLNLALSEHASEGDVSVLSKADEDDVLDVLAVAFSNDPAFAWVADLEEGDPEREEKVSALARSLHAYHSRNRMPWGIRGPDNELVGCMSLTPSSCHMVEGSILNMILCSIKHGVPPLYTKEKDKYGPHARGRLESMTVIPKARAKFMQDTKNWAYLQAIGVRPEYHGKGHGKKMLNLLTQTADSSGMALYLETEAERLESMYKRFGFRTLEKLDVCAPGDTSDSATFTMYLMRRDPVGA